jgi:hypothetical protein
VRLGAQATCTLTLVGKEGERYPADGVRLSLSAFAPQYTGHGRHSLGHFDTVVNPEDAQSKGIELKLDTGHADFHKMMLDTGFPLTVVGTAIWKDQNEGVTDTMGHVDENAVVALVTEESTELLPEEGTIIIQTAVEPAPQIGVESKVSLKIVNPFPHKALTNPVLQIEGRKLTQVPIPIIPWACSTVVYDVFLHRLCSLCVCVSAPALRSTTSTRGDLRLRR